jgi:hypothetical protein
VIALNPDAASMLSLFCVVVCVVEQPTNAAVHAVAIPHIKLYLISFIGSNRIVEMFPDNLLQKVIPVVICGPCMTVSKRKPLSL